MASWIETRYLKLASKRNLAIASVMFVISQTAIGILLRPIGLTKVLHLQLTFSSRTFAEILAQWGKSGVAEYTNHFQLDNVHALVYAIFLSSAIAYLTNRPGKKPETVDLGLCALPWIAAICDLAENMIHQYLIRHPEAIDGGLLIYSGICTWTKWSLAAISVATILALLIRKGRSHEAGIIQDT